MTGIAILLLIVNAVYEAYQAHKKQQSLSVNQFLFFGKTTSQKLSDSIDLSITAMTSH
ncbi:MAG: hypothetical protein H0U75_06605 [Legionella sp.]|nr:hypothetical protein [Legionella sp.]